MVTAMAAIMVAPTTVIPVIAAATAITAMVTDIMAVMATMEAMAMRMAAITVKKFGSFYLVRPFGLR